MSWLRRKEQVRFQGERISNHCWYCAKQIVGEHTSVVKGGRVLRVHNECRSEAAKLVTPLIEENPDYGERLPIG